MLEEKDDSLDVSCVSYAARFPECCLPAQLRSRYVLRLPVSACHRAGAVREPRVLQLCVVANVPLTKKLQVCS